MIKRILTLITVTIALAAVSIPARAQMSDDAVIAYVKQGMASGKTQDAMMKELATRGVTREQAERIRTRIQNEQKNAGSTIPAAGAQEAERRTSTDNTLVNPLEMDQIPEGENVADYVAEVRDSLKVEVFGHNIFTNRNLSFAPSSNLPTPKTYKLGPGDEVIIDIWGNNQASIRQTISPDGTINIPDLGLVIINGMTVAEADSYLRRKLGQIYSVDGEDAKSEIKLSLGNIRTIQVNVLGEVSVPGTYNLSSLSNLYHALYRAGGVSELGSLRDIQLMRNGKKVAEVDVYDFIFNGKAPEDITLEEGDIIVVPAYRNHVEIEGNVKRPMKYDVKEGETVADLIEYAGGFAGNAYKDNLTVVRQNGKEYQVFTVDAPDYASFILEDGDKLTVGQMLDRYSNRLEIKGAVYRPGIYQLGNGISTLSQLIAKADGLMGDAFTNRGLIHREREDLTLEVIPFDVKAIVNGTAADIELKKNDVVYIPSIHDIKDVGSFTVEGEVAKPGTFVFAENTTLEDVIMQAGGLLESASTVKIDISRRIKDPASTDQTEGIAEIITFAFKDGYVIDGEAGFVLQPYDYIYVRKSPSYNEQTSVDIRGEVVFPGTYSLTKRTERLSDLVAKAGGINQWAYVKGARLNRQLSAEEKTRMRSTLDAISSAKDSLNTDMLNIEDTYFVGIDLEAALANPGGEADLVLREGDILLVPQYNNTVRISGNVLYPNTVTYSPNMTVRQYVQQAGGYGFRSKKSKAYIVYMNGKVDRARQMAKGVVHPGCEIVIPKKRDKDGNLQEILGIATTATSLATTMATIGNLISVSAARNK